MPVLRQEVSPHERVDSYLKSNDIEEKISQAIALTNYDSITAQLHGMEMFFDLASMQAESGEDSSGLFQVGVHHLERLEDISNRYSLFPDSEVLLSTRRAGLDVLEALIRTDTLPDLDMVEAQYGELVFSAHQIYLNALTRGKLQNQRLCGAMSEASVLLLLTRFAQNERLDGFFPIRALFSHDRGGGQGPVANRWDISVALQFEAEALIDITHKVQVKTSRSNGLSVKYADDIPVVHVRHDLSNNPQQPINSWTIVEECGKEANGQSYFTNVLDNRTDRLINVIDPSE